MKVRAEDTNVLVIRTEMIFNTGSLGEITKRIEVYIEGLRIGLTLEQEATWSSSLGQTQSLAHTSC